MNKKFSLLWLALYRRRRMLIALTLGIVVFEVLIVVVVASLPPDQLIAAKLGNAQDLPHAFEAFSGSNGGVSLATYAGLLGAGLVHPFWIAMQLTAIGSFAAAVVAADVEQGTIELLMVRPVSRMRLLFERSMSVVFASALLNLAATVTVIIGTAISESIHKEISFAGIAAAGLMGFALSFSIGGIAVAVSASSSRKSHVVSSTIIVGAVGFAINFIALAWTKAESLRYVSPFHYYSPGDMLANAGEIPWGSLAVLMSTGIVGFLAAAWLLQRRDLAL